jgi:hypothetical protein
MSIKILIKADVPAQPEAIRNSSSDFHGLSWMRAFQYSRLTHHACPFRMIRVNHPGMKRKIPLRAACCAVFIVLCSCQSGSITRPAGDALVSSADTAQLAIEFKRQTYAWMGFVYYPYECRVKVRAGDATLCEAVMFPGDKIELTVPAGRVDIDYSVTSRAESAHSTYCTLEKGARARATLEAMNEAGLGVCLVFYAKPLSSHDVGIKFEKQGK